MTQYDQAMKHWGNHKKDRFFQQCAAPVASLQYPHLSEEEKRKRSNESLEALLDQAVDFPVFVHQDQWIGTWEMVPSNHLFGFKIASRNELIAFVNEYKED